MDFLANNWLALVSLVIALLGGVPGVLAVITHFKDKPKFYFSIVNLVTGEQHDATTNRSRSTILLSGTVANDGVQPLSPDRFELELDIDGRWKKFQPQLIPKDADFQSNELEIQIKNPGDHDLQKFSGAILRGTPIHGFLMFTSQDISLEKLKMSVGRNLSMKLTCIDIYGRKHYLEFKPGGHKITSQITFPKHGVSVQNKN